MFRSLTILAVASAVFLPAQTSVTSPVLSSADGSQPGGEEQDRILERMHDYADHYFSNLPNFICVQTTRQFEGEATSKKWHKGDVLVSRLSYAEGKEKRALDRVNGKAADPTKKRWRAPLTTEGEFGTLLSQVLGKNSEATFSWARWDMIRGKKMAVFNYSVDVDHSTLRLMASDGFGAVAAYSGSVYGDPETGAVWRISDLADDLPLRLQIRSVSTTVDYDQIAIGDKQYLLPLEASVILFQPLLKIRNDMQFENYQKFSADSSITFEDGASR